MKAVYFDKQLRLKEIPIPKPQKDEALIKIRMVGLCHTDLEILQGYMNFCGVLGHEFVGEVVESKLKNWLGRRVAGEINIGCGACELCQQNLQRHCSNRKVLGILDKDGCFAEYITLPVQNLHPIPDILSDKEAVFIEPLAAAYEILEQIHIKPTHRVAVIGDGKLGQLIARVVFLTGCQLFVFGRHIEKLELLKNLHVQTGLVTQRRSELYDIVIEASGSSTGFHYALNLVKPRGKLVLKSTFQKRINMNTSKLVIDEVTIIGSRCGPFSPVIRLLEMGIIDVKPLITQVFPFRQWKGAFKAAQSQGKLKILMSMLPDEHDL